MSRKSVFNSLSHAGNSSQLRVRLRHDIKISPFCVYSDDDDDDEKVKKSEEKRRWFQNQRVCEEKVLQGLSAIYSSIDIEMDGREAVFEFRGGFEAKVEKQKIKLVVILEW